jgi:cytochrome c553
VFACGFCHRADGPGGPENTDLAGLPKSYFIQQMAEYKRGARVTSVSPRNKIASKASAIVARALPIQRSP